MEEGLTYEQCIKVVKEEITNGNIDASNSYMNNQLATSKALATELKADKFDGKYLQYPWSNGEQILFNTEEDFYSSSYPYGIGVYSGLPSALV